MTDQRALNSLNLGLRTFALKDQTANVLAKRMHDATDIVIVIDASSSMHVEDLEPSRLGSAKTFCANLVGHLSHLQPKARLALIAFANDARMLFPLTPVSQAQHLVGAIDSLDALGLSNLTAGLRCTLKLVKRSENLPLVLLLTDGHHTGASDPIPVAASLKEFATIICIGFAGRPELVGEQVLRQVASRAHDGQPRYYWTGKRA